MQNIVRIDTFGGRFYSATILGVVNKEWILRQNFALHLEVEVF